MHSRVAKAQRRFALHFTLVNMIPPEVKPSLNYNMAMS